MKKIIAAFLIIFFSAATVHAADWSLADPGADRLIGWDDSATGAELVWFTLGTGLSITGTTISVGDLSGTYQPLDADLTTYAGITPSANVQSLLGAADYAAMRTALSLVPGTNVQAYDADLDTASTAGAAAVSTYFGKNGAGTVGFHALPAADLGFTVDAPGASGALLQSNGTKWERVTSLSGMTFGGFSNSMAVVSDGSGNLASDANVSATELGYLNGLTEALSTTLAAKLPMTTTKSTATTYTIGTTSANEAYGGVIYVTGACTVTAPAIATGMSFTVITIGAIAVSVDVNASDKMILDGVTLDDGDKATNTSTAGDMIVCTYYSADGWYCASGSNDGDLWTDGGP